MLVLESVYQGCGLFDRKFLNSIFPWTKIHFFNEKIISCFIKKMFSFANFLLLFAMRRERKGWDELQNDFEGHTIIIFRVLQEDTL